MNNILVTGSNGQLGNELRVLASECKAYNFFFTDIDELDVTNADKISRFIKSYKIDTLINCAAYTNVEKAEWEKTDAILVNVTAVKNIAQACNKADILMVHFSTDYVFDGKHYRPYTENDTAAPKSIYGKSKLDGEIEVIFNAKRAIIIRTSWLYSSFGNNFVKTIVEKATTLKDLRVVFDQTGTPTYAADLARVTLDILPKVKQDIRTEIYNYSNEGVASWYDFAKAIVDIKNLDCKIIPIPSKEYPTEANRPFFTVLDKSRIKNDFDVIIPHWRDSLEVCLSKLP